MNGDRRLHCLAAAIRWKLSVLTALCRNEMSPMPGRFYT